VIDIGNGLPSRGCIEANARALARYAALCQQRNRLCIIVQVVTGLHAAANTMHQLKDHDMKL